MIVSYHKEKAFNAITYFLEHTSMCNKKKLFKLLWLLDSEHFSKTGRSVTGYEYEAWQMGPVPIELDKAMKKNDPALLEYFDIETKGKTPKNKTITLKSKRPFERRFFSKTQADLLKDLVGRFGMSSGDEMEKWTHKPGSPWHRVWMIENKKKAIIPYEYALAKLQPHEKDAILNIAKEREAFLNSYR